MSVITTKSFKSFVLELKRLQKTGQAKIVSTSFRNGFFGAVVQEGKDDDYVYKLSQLSGDENENVLDLVDYLGGNKDKKVAVEVEPLIVELSDEAFTKLHEVIQESEEKAFMEVLDVVSEAGVESVVKQPVTKPPVAKPPVNNTKRRSRNRNVNND